METLPCTQTAVTQSDTGSPRLTHGVPLPDLLPGTVIVKTVAVALNPSDNKMGAAFPTPGAIVGMDFSGTIAAVHPSLSTADDARLTIGNRVCGMVHGSNPGDPTNGAFAQYVRTKPELLLTLPKTMSMQEAATLGVGLMTNVMALWDPLALGLPLPPDIDYDNKSQTDEPLPVLVYGGSTATGILAIQLIRLLCPGMEPIVTCSPRNKELVCSRGVRSDAVFDYMDPGVVEAIRARTGNGRLRYAYDCVGDATTSMAHCYAALGRVGGRYVHLDTIVPEGGGDKRRRVVKTKLVLAYQATGEDVPLPGEWGTKADPEKFALAVKCMSMFQRLLDRGMLKAHPVQEVGRAGSGLELVLEGLRVLKSGVVSGKKLVVTL
ncbi:Enoyl reductase LovC [Rhypophila decipiens]